MADNEGKVAGRTARRQKQPAAALAGTAGSVAPSKRKSASNALQSSSSASSGLPEDENKTCVLILGMHRSGTSALTRLVSMLGATLPRNLLGSGEGNEAGHWEPARLIDYHDRMLSELNSAWYDWTPLDIKGASLQRRETIASDIAELVAEEYGAAPLIVVKEPRISRFAQFFSRVLVAAGYDLKVVVTFRNPLDVIDSLMARKSVWPADRDRADAALSWLIHMLESERAARSFPHVVVSYEASMADPSGSLRRLTETIGLETPKAVDDIASDIKGFINEAHRHHAHRPDEVPLDPQLSGWVADTYAALRDLEQGRDPEGARGILDNVRHEFMSAMPLMKATASARRSAEAKAVAAEQKAADLAAQRDGYAAEIAKLHIAFGSERDALVSELGEVQQQWSVLDKAFHALQAEHASSMKALQKEIEAAGKREKKSNAQLVEARSELDGLRKDMAALTSRLEATRPDEARLEEREKEHDEALARAAELEATIDSLRESHGRELAMLSAELESERQKAAAESATRIARLAELLQSREDVQAALDVMQQENPSVVPLRAKLKRSKAETSRARDDYERLDAAFASVRDRQAKRIDELQQEIERHQRRFDEAAALFAQAERQLQDTRQHARNLEDSLREQGGELLRMQGQVSDTHLAYTQSTSWKLTGPIRGVGMAAKGFRSGLSLAPSALKVGGGLFPSIGKAVRILRTEGAAGVRKRLDLVRRMEEVHAPVPMAIDSRPLVSVIVPNYNHAPFLEQRLETIYAQDYPNFEVILLDDCSPDNSREILEAYQRKYASITRYVPNETNSGSGYRQWAKGLGLARGELVWIAESDDWSDPGFLSRLVPLFTDEALSLAYVNSSFVSADGTREVWTTDAYLDSLDSQLWKQPFVSTGHQLARIGWSLKNLVPNVSSAVFRHPGRDNDLLRGDWTNMRICGDWLLYLNLAKGARIAYLPEKLNFYRIHEGSTAKSTFSKDVYYSEHAAVARFALETFDITPAFLEQQESNLRTHWAQNRTDFSENAFRNCYDPKRILSAVASRKPNILMCGYAFAAGGGETFPIFLANLFKAKGYTVTFLSFEQEPREQGVRSLLRPDIPVVCDFRNIARIIEDFGIDVIHSHHAWVDNTILDLIGTGTRAATVISTHGMYEGLADIDQDRIVPRVERMCDAIVYTAEKNLAPFTRLDLAASEKLTRISNALPDVPVEPADLRELGIPDSAFVLCLVSRAIPEKGWQEAIDAVALARQECGVDIQLLLIGEGKEYDRLKPVHSGGHVHFLGFRRNLRDYYAAADVGFLPSRFPGESFPLTLIDCLAVGKPVLASAIGEIPQMLEGNGETAGILFDLDDWTIPVPDVARAIANLASDEAFYSHKKDLVPVAFRKFDPAHMIHQYGQVYERVFRGRAGA